DDRRRERRVGGRTGQREGRRRRQGGGVGPRRRRSHAPRDGRGRGQRRGNRRGGRDGRRRRVRGSVPEDLRERGGDGAVLLAGIGRGVLCGLRVARAAGTTRTVVEAVVGPALPRDDEVRRIGRRAVRRHVLVGRRERVDHELRADSIAGGVELLEE